MRWTIYLLVSFVMQLVALVITPLLPLFASPREGRSENGNVIAVGPRLPRWLAWFDTPDNDLYGDPKWRTSHDGGHWSQVGWLYRNSLYQFKWSVLSAPIDRFKVMFDGDRLINRNNGHYGELRVKMGDYWQYKLVKPIGSTGYCWMLNFGWLLDDTSQDRALFMFSPRLVKITFQGNVNA